MRALKSLLANKRIGVAIFYSIDSEAGNKNMVYLCGYSGVGALVVPAKSPAFLVAPEMEHEKAKQGKTRVYRWEKGKRLFDQISSILKKKKIRLVNVGIVERDFTLDVYKSLRKYIKKVKFKDIGRDMVQLRSIKSAGEIQMLKRACSISSEIMHKCIKNFKRFKTEKDVANYLRIETIKRGCEMSFPPVVASGASSSMAHATPRNVKIKKGFCVIDYGAKYNGYHGDVSRTIYVGNPTSAERKIYDLLLKTQEQLIKCAKRGMKASVLYDKTLKYLGKYATKFTHGLGHGLGLNIHELPNLTLKSMDVLESNMVFTIEPGVYFAGKFGIRIEDDILITDKKTSVLTKVPKKLITIK